MKSGLVGALAGAALSVVAVQAASAADIPAPVYKAAVAVAPYSWAGCYVGLNVGAKRARTSGDVGIAAAPPFTTAVSAPLGGSDTTLVGGGQIGCNWQSGQIVYGIEGDFDIHSWSITNTLGASPPPLVAGDFFNARGRWQASIRGRLGYAWDRALLYMTGGIAFADMQVTSTFIPIGVFPGTIGSERKTLTGATLGAGIEYALNANWSTALEGRYTWYGSNGYAGGPVAVFLPVGAGFVFAPATTTLKLNTAEVLLRLNYRFR